MNFYTALLSEILENLHNPYHPAANAISAKNQINHALKSFSKRLGVYKIDFYKTDVLKLIAEFDPYFEDLNQFYQNLETDSDKHLLVQLMTFRILKSKIRLPLNTPHYYERIQRANSTYNLTDFIISKSNVKLHKANLSSQGIPITLYSDGPYHTFILEQYRYQNGSISIGAKKGDHVIDAGGCFGDTALYFSNIVKEEGRVYSFEFIPSNLEIFKKNLELNPDLAESVAVEEKPVWEYSDRKFYYKDWGPGSIVAEENSFDADGVVSTISLDDFVVRNSISKIDMIKMDIEGAEYYALKGAASTIQKFHPVLAIALYHSIEDFARIPKLIKIIHPGYKFYLAHCTDYIHETILFAVDQ